jgi:CRISPR/Cas system CMR-associated protein Cmr1 (group 7 of RAMP superfamily)
MTRIKTVENTIAETPHTKTNKRMASLLESVSYWSGVAAVTLTGLAALAGVVTWYSSSKLAAKKDEDFRQFRQTSESEIAAANERAAKLEKEAEEARLKTATIQSIVEWRSLSKDQIDKLRNALSSKPSSVRLTYVSNDPEALYFAIKLSERFTNWKVSSGARTYSGTLVFGIRIVGSVESDVNLGREAFRDAEIPFSTDSIPGSSVEFGSVDQAVPNVEIIIGSKLRQL